VSVDLDAEAKDDLRLAAESHRVVVSFDGADALYMTLADDLLGDLARAVAKADAVTEVRVSLPDGRAARWRVQPVEG
jgi:putative heme iron utilization protein